MKINRTANFCSLAWGMFFQVVIAIFPATRCHGNVGGALAGIHPNWGSDGCLLAGIHPNWGSDVRLEQGFLEEEIKYDKTYAVIVAISDYQYFPGGPGGDLHYTDADARKFYQYLVSPTGGQVAAQNVVLLINQAATKSSILKMLDHVFSKAKPNDRIIFYFSGHGQAGYLLPSDAIDIQSLISYEQLKTVFKNSKAKTKICFIDACHANSIKLSGKKEASNTATQTNDNSSVIVMVSSQSYQSSVEDSNLKQGAFSYYLLKGLKGEADADGDKTITIAELHKYVYFNVKKYTYDKQVPHTFGKFDLDMPVAVLK